MNKYPTEEELELFIKKMEEQELYAPRHMKEQILSQAFPNQTGKALPDSGGSIQFLAYRLKIIAGMAAALFMLMILPMQERSLEVKDEAHGNGLSDIWEQEIEKEDTIDINNMLNEGIRRANRKVNSWFERMGDLQFENLFNRKDGGYIDEN